MPASGKRCVRRRLYLSPADKSQSVSLPDTLSPSRSFFSTSLEGHTSCSKLERRILSAFWRAVMNQDLIIGMAGSGGDGIVSAGESLITAAALEGYYAILTKSFGSQIRGGESSCRLRISTKPVLNPAGTLDVAVALNWDDFLRFGAELTVGGRTLVIYDRATGVAPDRPPLAGVAPAAAIP